MVLDKLRKGLRSEPAFVAQLREHKWTSEEQKRELLEKFHALSKPDAEWIVWTALDPVPEIRAAGLAILRRRHDRAGLEALVPLLKTRSEAVRRAVMRFLKELAGPQLGPFLPGDRRPAATTSRASPRSSSRGSFPPRPPSTSRGGCSPPRTRPCAPGP